MEKRSGKMRRETPDTTAQAPQEEKQRIIRNRDIPLLNSIFYIMQDIVSLENRRDWQRGRMFSTTKRLTGMPGGGTPMGFDAVLAALEELDDKHHEQLKMYVRELREAERILNTIPCRTMRTFVQMYYIDEISRADIMRELNMTKYSFDQARDAIEKARDMAHVAWKDKYVLEDAKKFSKNG